MKKLLPLLLTLAAACSAPLDGADRERGTALGKADSIGSCAGQCGDIGDAGDCYCDDACSDYGDCCDDVAVECQLDECNPTTSTGCDYGELCVPGVCLAFCLPDDPGCCQPATCQPVAPPTCESLGGTCESSPFDPTFSANCEAELGRETLDGTCAAFNQSCCGGPMECPSINPPAPGFCDDDEELSPIEEFGCIVGFECVPVCPNINPPPPGFCDDDEIESPIVGDNGCVIGFECVGNDSCSAMGGFCSPASVGCPADTGSVPDGICADADSVCCIGLIF
jgi:hypothetical protein